MTSLSSARLSGPGRRRTGSTPAAIAFSLSSGTEAVDGGDVGALDLDADGVVVGKLLNQTLLISVAAFS